MGMIGAAAGDDTKIEPALLRLQLTSAQFNTAAQDYRDFLKEDEDEDKNIARHQRLMNKALLSGHKAYSTREGFQAIAAVHLYKHVGRSEAAIEQSDLDNARAYMKHCQLDTAFLDDYHPSRRQPPPLDGPVTNSTLGHDGDTLSPPAASVSQPLAIDEAIQSPTLPVPSTPVLRATTNGDIPTISLTPVAQRHHTPPTLSPVPLQLGTPILTQSVTYSPSSNNSSSRRSTASAIEVEVDGLRPLQGSTRAGILNGNHNLANGDSLPQGSSSTGSPEATIHTSPTPIVPTNGNSTHRHHPSPSNEHDPLPKRQRPNPPTPSSSHMPSNGISASPHPSINGTHNPPLNGIHTPPSNGTAAPRNIASRLPYLAPIPSINGSVRQPPSLISPEREAWGQRNGYTNGSRSG
ncbi:MAG: hypothetical protein Q9168_005809, partial [Polycauliona sp. 1 TL-2023]